MKNLKHVFFLIFMLCAQQIYAISCGEASVVCEGKKAAQLQAYEADKTNFDNWFGPSYYAANYPKLSCTPLSQPQYGTTETILRIDIPGYQLLCEVPSCPQNQVLNTDKTGCTFPPPSSPSPIYALPPPCPAGKYLVELSGNCEFPVVCLPPQINNTTANICATSNATSTNAANACNAGLDICNAAKAKSQIKGVSCILHTSPKHGASTCMVGPESYRMNCSSCAGGDPYPVDVKTGADIVEGGAMGGNPPTGSGTSSAPKEDLEFQRTNCEGKGGKFEEVIDNQKTTFANTADKYNTYWKCTTKTGEETYYGNGGVPLYTNSSNKSQDQNLNCGGTTGIACESTQLKSAGLLEAISKSLDFDVTKPFFDTTKVEAMKKEITDSLKMSELSFKDVPEVNAFFSAISKVTTTGCNGVKFLPDSLGDGDLKIDMKEVNKASCDLIAIIRGIIIATTLLQAAVFIAKD